MSKTVLLSSVCILSLIGCASDSAQTKQKSKFYPPRIESHNCTYPLDEIHRNLYYQNRNDSNNQH